jgi:TRAP-type C4-dicarboxylate transport system permease small subunit
LHTLALAFLLVLSGLLARRAWDVVSESLLFNAKDTSALSIPLAVPQSLWAVGLSVFVVLVALMFLEALLLLASGRREAVDRMLVPRSLQEETGEALEAAGLAHGAEARDDAEAPTLRGAP